MKVKAEKQERVEYCLRYTFNKDSDEEILLKYLKIQRYEPVNQLILQAVMSYWFPLALEAEKEDSDPKKLKQLAEESIYILRRQADYFACKFGIDLEDLPRNYYQKESQGIADCRL